MHDEIRVLDLLSSSRRMVLSLLCYFVRDSIVSWNLKSNFSKENLFYHPILPRNCRYPLYFKIGHRDKCLVNISKFSKSRFTILFAYCNSRKFSRTKIVKILIFNKKKKKKKNKRFQILILRVKIFANIKIRFDYTSSINLIKINTTKRKRKK